MIHCKARFIHVPLEYALFEVIYVRSWLWFSKCNIYECTNIQVFCKRRKQNQAVYNTDLILKGSQSSLGRQKIVRIYFPSCSGGVSPIRGPVDSSRTWELTHMSVTRRRYIIDIFICCCKTHRQIERSHAIFINNTLGVLITHILCLFVINYQICKQCFEQIFYQIEVPCRDVNTLLKDFIYYEIFFFF